MGKVLGKAILIYGNMEDRMVQCYLAESLTESQSQAFRPDWGVGKHLSPLGDSRPWTAGSLPNGPTMMGSPPWTHNTHLQSQAPWGCWVVLFSFSHPMAYSYLPHEIAKYLLSVGPSPPWDCRDDQEPTSTPVPCSLGQAQLCHSPPHLEVCAQALCPACLSFLFI